MKENTNNTTNNNANNIKSIRVIAQSFYGNRTGVELHLDEIDSFICGYLSSEIQCNEKIDRTIIRVPNTEIVVFIYNKYEEEKFVDRAKKYDESDGGLVPTLEIPEMGIILYSRVIACCMNAEGKLSDIGGEESKEIWKYLAK